MPPASYTFEDLSGAKASASGNPYDGLLEACNNDPTQLQDRYTVHRETRATQQRAKLLAPDFPGVTVDQILLRLANPTIEPGFRDPRHCLVFWTRPTSAVKSLIAQLQSRIQTASPNFWLMPQDSLHMTALEITHSLTAPEISTLVDQVMPIIETVTDFPYDHRARLVKPLITYDAQALALSFLPAAGEALQSGRTAEDDEYSYHHLRRDLYQLITDAGVKVASRYVVPSAHLTIGRFIDKDEFETADGAVDHGKVQKLVEVIEECNAWLKQEYWPKANGGMIKEGGEWLVGHDKGLDCRRGTLWYGGGETIRLGKGY